MEKRMRRRNLNFLKFCFFVATQRIWRPMVSQTHVHLHISKLLNNKKCLSMCFDFIRIGVAPMACGGSALDALQSTGQATLHTHSANDRPINLWFINLISTIFVTLLLFCYCCCCTLLFAQILIWRLDFAFIILFYWSLAFNAMQHRLHVLHSSWLGYKCRQSIAYINTR